MASMKSPWIDVALFVLASPVLFGRALWRTRKRYLFFRLATATGIVCECGAMVSLVGQWKCSCGYTYCGHLLRACPVCGTSPCVVRCFACGVTTKLPEVS